MKKNQLAWPYIDGIVFSGATWHHSAYRDAGRRQCPGDPARLKLVSYKRRTVFGEKTVTVDLDEYSEQELANFRELAKLLLLTMSQETNPEIVLGADFRLRPDPAVKYFFWLELQSKQGGIRPTLQEVLSGAWSG